MVVFSTLENRETIFAPSERLLRWALLGPEDVLGAGRSPLEALDRRILCKYEDRIKVLKLAKLIVYATVMVLKLKFFSIRFNNDNAIFI